MKFIQLGGKTVISALDRIFAFNDTAHNAVCQLEWAYVALKRENESYPNGTSLHENANKTVERYEDILIAHRLF